MSRRRRGASAYRDSEGRKECVSCRLWKHPVEFSASKRELDQLLPKCKPCDAIRKRAIRYGITEERIQAMFAMQRGCCAICRSHLASSYHIDHDHSCCPIGSSCGACVRGLLCNSCNVALGGFKDSSDLLLAAAQYITLHSQTVERNAAQ